MQASEFDEAGFFQAIATSGARALLIGRRALVAPGIPVLTADYDFRIHIDDIGVFNGAVEPQGLFPTRTPEEARGRGRYVFEALRKEGARGGRRPRTPRLERGLAICGSGVSARRRPAPPSRPPGR